jgi:hypothetical protein
LKPTMLKKIQVKKAKIIKRHQLIPPVKLKTKSLRPLLIYVGAREYFITKKAVNCLD